MIVLLLQNKWRTPSTLVYYESWHTLCNKYFIYLVWIYILELELEIEIRIPNSYYLYVRGIEIWNYNSNTLLMYYN